MTDVDPTSRIALLAYALLGGFVLLLLGQPVPYNNEHHYLYSAYRLFHPDFAPTQPGLGDPLYAHLVFQTIAGALMTIMPLEVVGWALRLLSWAAIVATLIMVARLLGVRPWAAAIAIALWLLNWQTVLAQEWVMGGVEAKTFAYPLLFLSIHFLLTGRPYVSAMLIGLGVTFHGVVGVQLGGAICFGSLFVRRGRWSVPAFAGLVVLFSLPGIVSTLYGSLNAQPLTTADWEFLARFAMPYHLNPTSFAKRDFLTLAVLLGFNLLTCWKLRDEETYRFLGMVQVFLAVVFVAGLAAWTLGAYSFLQVFPFRVLPVLTLLLFFLFLAALIRRNLATPALLATAIWGLLALGEPVSSFVDIRVNQRASFGYPVGAFDWIAEETSNDALVLSPPWAPNSLSRTRRGQVAYYRWIQTRDLDDWRARLRTVLGPLEQIPGPEGLHTRYDQITMDRLRAVHESYGATHFVTTGDFRLPLLFEDEDGWRVYSLEGLGSD